MIKGRVMVTMQNNKTSRAFEGSPTQRHINILPAVIASMTASFCSWVLRNYSTACYSLVFQEVCEHSPSSIAYLSCPEAVIHHTFDVQLLNGDEVIFIDEFPAKFVQKVSPLIYNLDMLFIQPENSFSSVFRTFDFPAQSSLQELQSLFGFDEETGISYLLSIGKSSEVLQADINANLLSRGMLDFCIWQFTGEDSKPLPYFILLDGESLNLTFRNTMQDNRNASNLTQSNPPVRKKLETRLRKGDAVNPTFEAGKSFFFGILFDPSEEVLESLMHSVRDILYNLRMDFIPSFDKIVVVKFIEACRAKFVSINRQCKKFIVNCLASLERINQSYLLLSRRIQTIFIHLNDHRGKIYV